MRPGAERTRSRGGDLPRKRHENLFEEAGDEVDGTERTDRRAPTARFVGSSLLVMGISKEVTS
jgi:hypothetical protein